MRRRILVTLGCGVLTGLGATWPTVAHGESVKPDQITCAHFLAMDPDEQQHTAYWIEGYTIASGQGLVGGVVPLDSFNRPAKALVDACQKDPKAMLVPMVKQHLK